MESLSKSESGANARHDNVTIGSKEQQIGSNTCDYFQKVASKFPEVCQQFVFLVDWSFSKSSQANSAVRLVARNPI
jgi:hypothetical protein